MPYKDRRLKTSLLFKCEHRFETIFGQIKNIFCTGYVISSSQVSVFMNLTTYKGFVACDWFVRWFVVAQKYSF